MQQRGHQAAQHEGVAEQGDAAAFRGDERVDVVPDVLDHREAEADHRRVDDAVGRAVDFVPAGARAGRPAPGPSASPRRPGRRRWRRRTRRCVAPSAGMVTYSRSAVLMISALRAAIPAPQPNANARLARGSGSSRSIQRTSAIKQRDREQRQGQRDRERRGPGAGGERLHRVDAERRDRARRGDRDADDEARPASGQARGPRGPRAGRTASARRAAGSAWLEASCGLPPDGAYGAIGAEAYCAGPV